MKPAGWVGVLVIVAALAFGSRAFVANLTPYITFDQARTAKGQVQIVGKLDKTSVAANDKVLRFALVDDKNDRIPVAFSDVRPPNFEMATQITAIGAYDGQTFQADKLLVKCPSKYQGTDAEKGEGSGGAREYGTKPEAGSGGRAAALTGLTGNGGR